MRRIQVVVVAGLAAAFLCGSALGENAEITLATTTSTQATGLLDYLLPEFTKDTGITVKVIAKGTGAALRDGIDGNADVLMVHAVQKEKEFVGDGWGTMRFAIMHNDFVIVGPPNDPAGIKKAKTAAEALKRIAESGEKFVSRGDDSGTHTKEQELWAETVIELESEKSTIVEEGKPKEFTRTRPKAMGQKYFSIGQGMGKTLSFADEKEAYTLSDRGTYIKFKYGQAPVVDLDILCEGDPALYNPYGVIPVNPVKHPHVKYKESVKFAEWLVSPKGQKLIRDYRQEGRQMFFPDAITVFAP